MTCWMHTLLPELFILNSRIKNITWVPLPFILSPNSSAITFDNLSIVPLSFTAPVRMSNLSKDAEDRKALAVSLLPNLVPHKHQTSVAESQQKGISNTEGSLWWQSHSFSSSLVKAKPVLMSSHMGLVSPHLFSRHYASSTIADLQVEKQSPFCCQSQVSRLPYLGSFCSPNLWIQSITDSLSYR